MELQNTKFIGIIPARYASTRFPGKPLVDILGKSMLQRVYEQACKAGLANVVVATDDERIANHVSSFKGKFVMTLSTHQSGTDRCNEAAEQLHLDSTDVVINIQGDEPFIQPQQIDLLANCFTNPSIEIATLIKQIKNREELEKVTIPKVVIDSNNNAIYFSRSVIPFAASNRTTELLQEGIYYKHIGIYAYRVSTLKKLAALKQSKLERAES